MRVKPCMGGQGDRNIALAKKGKKGRTWNEWHRVLGHVNMRSIKLLKEKGLVTGMEVDQSEDAIDQCEVCIKAKQHVKPFPKESTTEIAAIGDLTVSDVWGPARTAGLGGFLYFVTFTDVKKR